MNITDFIYDQMAMFSRMDNTRSIPALIDGLKDVQRKAIYGLQQTKAGEIKVAQLGGQAALITHYAHGEKAMCDAIVLMAQNYPGSNNLNMFKPCGQFGNILSPKSGSVRYIYTEKSDYFDVVFRTEDEVLLTGRSEELTTYEPYFYLPVIPLWAVNGAEGIGTGHSTAIMPRGVRAVCDTITALLKGETVDPEWCAPQYRGRECTIKPHDAGWLISGVISKTASTELTITGIPVGVSLDRYKQVLVDLMTANVIKDFDNESDEERFKIVVRTTRELAAKSQDELLTIFKLTKKVSENVTLHDPTAGLVRFADYLSALTRWVEVRAPYYEHRKDHLIHETNLEIDFLEAQNGFIELFFERAEKGLQDAVALQLESERKFGEVYTHDFMRLPVSQISEQRFVKNLRKVKELQTHLAQIEATTPTDMFIQDLNKIMAVYS